jgi:predicted NACHT family NTPase
MTGLEPLIGPAATAAVTVAANWLKDIAVDVAQEETGGVLGGLLQRDLGKDAKQVLFNASRKYVENYRRRHGQLKVLGMRKPVDLESVYTAVRLLEHEGIKQFASVEDLEKAYRKAGQTRLRGSDDKKQQKKPGISVANQEQFLMVLGEPGAGKSTFLRRMGLAALVGKKAQKDTYKHRCIPVYIELKRWTEEEIDIQRFIEEEFATCGFPRPKQFLQKALRKGKLLILLDGLDEVPTDNQINAITQIQDFVDLHHQNRYIASCRIAAYRSNFRRFSDVAMADFNNDQIKQFIDNWFQADSEQLINKGKKCWKLLQQPENKGAEELAHTPLLLTFLCLVYDRSQSFPHNRSELYSKALRILLEEWAAEKCILQEDIYKGLNVGLEEILLAEIACRGFAQDQLFFSQQSLVNQIKKFLANNLNAPKYLDGEAILEAIAIQQGILVERAEGVFSFSHLTLQEYLTAQYITDRNSLRGPIQKHLVNRRWQEVFILIAGLLRGGAEPLLLTMERQAQTYLRQPKLKALIKWAEEATDGSIGNFKPAAKRSAALSLSLTQFLTQFLTQSQSLTQSLTQPQSLDLSQSQSLSLTQSLSLSLSCSRSLSRSLSLSLSLSPSLSLSRLLSRSRSRSPSLDLNLCYEFENLEIFKTVNWSSLAQQLQDLQSKIPDDNEPKQVREAFVRQYFQVWFDALHLDPEWVNLTADETQALEHYLYACELMVRCKQAAVRLSPQTWQAIEDRILTVPN